MSQRVLIVNHYWPPTGGPCVQRWVDFSTWFANNDFQVTVLTPENPGFPYTDASLLQRVDPKIRVVKVGYKNLVSGTMKKVGSNFITRFVRGNFFLPDPRLNWNKHAETFIKKHLNEFDVIITAGPPHSTHFIGKKFRKQFKWIADFHDYWTDALYLDQFHRLWPAQWIDKWLEKSILKNADAVLVHCQTAKNRFQQKTKKPIHIIPMGFYEKIFPNTTPSIESKVISHVGSFFTFYKSAIPLIKSYLEKGYTFRQIGPVEEGVWLPEGTEVIPYVPHEQAIAYMCASEKLLLINHRDFLPGKLFEYLGSMRPIILVSPKGSDAENLINENQDRTREERFNDFSRSGIAKKLADIIKDL